MILSIVGNWHDAEAEHGLYLSNLIQKYILANEVLEGPHTVGYYFVREVKDLILSRELSDLLLSNQILDRYKKNLGSASASLIKELTQIFNYKRFTVKSSKWNAYSLCKKSKARICPYCNHAYAFTVQSDNGDFRPTLDHFFYKDEYPHLALTLYNLIPSCSTCNSSLKGQADFYKQPHLNPLFDSDNIEFYFSFGGDTSELSEAIHSRRDDLQIKARAVTLCGRSENSLKTFVINERYDMLTVEAVDFYLAKASYDEAVINTQLNLILDEPTSLRFDRALHDKYLLGKMYADIYDAFKI